MEVFFCREGYLRTCGFEYSLDNCQDNKIHLTNNAVQKNANNYGQFEDGNMLDFDQLQAIIDTHHNPILAKLGKPPVSVREDIVEDIKFVVAKTMDSVKRKLDPNKRNGCFELFGYDFMVDNDLTVWLIEVNTNPCLETSSRLLGGLLPRVLDDAFKLTIDKDFPNPLVHYHNQVESFIKSKQQELKTFGKTQSLAPLAGPAAASQWAEEGENADKSGANENPQPTFLSPVLASPSIKNPRK